MKILIEQVDSRSVCYRWHKYIKCLHWNKATPAFDIFRFEPNIFIGTTWTLDRATVKNILQRPKLKVILAASPNDEIRRNERELVKQIPAKLISPRPLEDLSKWAKLGFQTELVRFSYDETVYRPGRIKDEYKSDVTYIGSINEFTLPYILPLRELDINLKIFSNDPVTLPEIVGTLPETEYSDAWASAKLVLNLEKFGDSIYNILYSGATPISTDDSYLEDYIHISDPRSVVCTVQHWLNRQCSLSLLCSSYQQIIQRVLQ